MTHPRVLWASYSEKLKVGARERLFRGGKMKELYQMKGEGQSIRGIARELGLSRKPVRKYLLVCQGLKQPRGPEVIPVLVRAFPEYGLPRAIRADNGRTDNSPTFASVGLGALAVWWVKLEIIPERIEARAERAARTSASDPQKGDLRSSQAH